VGTWAALPVLPAFPAEIVAETLALIGIEIKLIAECLLRGLADGVVPAASSPLPATPARWPCRRSPS
jgi:hypothetical protein